MSPGDFFDMTYRIKRSLVKKLIYTLLVGVAVYLLVLLFKSLVPKPPFQEIEQAREAIAVARDHNSVIYSPKIFREARSYYDSAMISWRIENERFIIFRDYEKVREFAAIANKKALDATRATIAKSNSLKTNLASEIKRLKGEMASFENIFQSMPVPQDVRKKHARGKLLLKEAEIDLNKENFVSGNVKITEANEYISDAYSLARKKLDEYFRGYSDWQDLAVSTITDSRRTGSYAILIEKIPPRLHLYQGGKKKYTFDAEFGSNWIGDKNRRGDMATPEGKYKVTKKLSRGSTKYYKALMINYPNKQDVEEFNSRLKNGQIPEDSRIGDLIEIHGDGGKGGNWTQGCVALKNSDMDLLFKYVSAGTPVTIIGSTSTLGEFLSSR